jgi:hypothetical protein
MSWEGRLYTRMMEIFTARWKYILPAPGRRSKISDKIGGSKKIVECRVGIISRGQTMKDEIIS